MIHPAFLFPGQGSQSVGMGRDLYERFPAARAVFDEADAALGFRLSEIIFDGPEEALKLTEHTQPAILTVSTAALRVLTEALTPRGIRPVMAAGHSLGEYTAHVAAGTLPFADAVRAVRLRGRYMQEAVPAGDGEMAAILGLSPELVVEICAQVEDALTPLPGSPAVEDFRAQEAIVSAANLNSPEQTVISGAAGAVKRAVHLCKEAGAKRTVMLAVSAPFHCALMMPARLRLAADLAGLAFRDPAFPVVANLTAEGVTTGDEARRTLVDQVTEPVRWVECVQRLVDPAGTAPAVTHLIEVGPGRVLTGLTRQILGRADAAPGRAAPVSLNVEDAVSLEKTIAALIG
ncbi:MAG: ACP S-malonyltransferase [Acidobacteriota bacterium]|nr:ACP S-malonyltransferase [Acidobacteriota bacterium]